MKATPQLSEQLLTHIERCGLTMYQLSKATGVDQATLSRFLNGRRSISLDAADKIGAFLGLKIISTKKRKG